MRLLPVLLILFCTFPALAGVVGWRGDGSNAYPAASPLTKWSVTGGVQWDTELPNWSNACPVPVGDRLFVCAEPSTLICLDLTGKILWQHSNSYDDFLTDEEKAKLVDERVQMAPLNRRERQLRTQENDKRKAWQDAVNALKDKPDDITLQAAVAQAKTDLDVMTPLLNDVHTQQAALTLANLYRMPPTNPTNGYSSDTPVSDGTFVYASYGNGVVVCYSLDGKRQWGRLVEKPTHGWGHSCSPLLAGGKLLVAFLDLIALDPASGREVWRVKMNKNWGTPALAKLGPLDVAFTDCGNVVNVVDGKILGSAGFNLDFGSPLIAGDIAYCASGNKAAAFQLVPKDDGTLQVTKCWQARVANARYYASPLLVDGLLYLLNQNSVLSVLDVKTGEKVYEQNLNLGGTAYPSPVLDGNVIIVSSDTGKVVILTPGRTYQEVARIVFDPFRTTLAFTGKRMYIRTTPNAGTPSKLYCFGE